MSRNFEAADHVHEPTDRFQHTRPESYSLVHLQVGEISHSFVSPDREALKAFMKPRILGEKFRIVPWLSEGNDRFIDSKWLNSVPLDAQGREAVRVWVRDYIGEENQRSTITRFEREKLRDLLIEARQRGFAGEISNDSLHALRLEVHAFAKKMDCFTRKMPMVNTDLETLPGRTKFVQATINGLPEKGIPLLGEVGIRAIIMYLRNEQQEGLKAAPLVFFSGWAADFKSLAAVEILAAAGGRPVISISMPEHYTTVKPKSWGGWMNSWVKASKTDSGISPFWGHAQAMVEVLKKLKESYGSYLDFDACDLTGYSAGGALALSVADYLTANPDPSLHIRNIYAFNPIGFYPDNPFLMAFNFARAGIDSMKREYEKRRTFVVQRGFEDFWKKGAVRVVRDVFGKTLFNQGKLAAMQVLGQVKVFIGDKDLVTDHKLIEEAINKANKERDGRPTINCTLVEGGGHNMMVGAAAYVAKVINGEIEAPRTINYMDLHKSYADVLRGKYS